MKAEFEMADLTAAAMLSAPQMALSIRQPWAWLIVLGYKPVENRTWPTKFRGRVYIHAGKTMTRREYDQCSIYVRRVEVVVEIQIPLPRFEAFKKQCGGIVGEATVTDCVMESKSPWFCGPYGFTIANPKPLPFHPCRGELGFFKMKGKS